MLVNLHTHTIFSDGEQTPEALASSLAAAGVRYAVLTDHDTVEGLTRFSRALEAHGIPSLPGIELTTHEAGTEVHLLAYGVDPDHSELAATLVSVRQARSQEVASIAGSLRRAGSRRAPDGPASPATSAAPDGHLDIGDAIALIHRAGGRAFLAHPLVYEADPTRLEAWLVRLRALGLDGVEAVYAQFSERERALLGELAHRHGLLVSAGTDFHGPTGIGEQPPAIDFPQSDWVAFRSAVLSGPVFATPPTRTPRPDAGAATRPDGAAVPARRFQPRSFALRVVVPALAALAVFLAGLWGLILPSFEETLLDRKRELIQELTNAAWSILAAHHEDEVAGLATRQEAQDRAAALVKDLRYGPQGKDYFWIQDGEPRMIMHPYRPELDGQLLASFRDPRGVPIFEEFADLVREAGQGYLDYVWQWQDDPDRLEPKESFVKGFQPWGWIIGTGLYTDDVRAEIGRMEQDLVLAALGISGAIAVLLLVVLQQSLRIERRRQEVVEGLRESTERYHALVEATTEGTLLVLDGRCRYANPTFLELVGYTARQLEFLELSDLLPRRADNDGLWQALDGPDPGSSGLGEAREGALVHRDGTLVECILALDPIVFEGQPGHILLARDVTHVAASGLAGTAALETPAGVFRAVPARRGVFLELSHAGRDLVAGIAAVRGTDATGAHEDAVGGGAQPALADLFADPGEYARFLSRLLADGEVRDHVVAVETPGGPRSIAVSGSVVRDETGHPTSIDGLLVDVTAVRAATMAREDQLEKLQASLLFLHEPVAELGHDPVVVGLDVPLGDVAGRMTERGATAALVASEGGAIIGIVTDLDLRSRAMAERRTIAEPVHAVMSAPVIRIPRTALVYEALMRMEEHGVRHLALEDQHGTVVGMLDHAALVRFPRYGPLVLLREIGRAETPDEVSRACARTVPLAQSLGDASVRSRHVTSMLTSVLDAATVRLIELALADMGPAPAPFAYLAMGSQGREEVTLLTDQDSAIVFSLDGVADTDDALAWYLRLGARVSEGLQRAGFPRCRGKVMADEPRWCRSSAAWLATVDAWIARAEPQDIADLSVFLDLRVIHGDAALADAIRDRVHASLGQAPAALYHLSRNALAFRPPARLPGSLLGGGSEGGGRIDLKDALMPIVAFARVYAARHGIVRTHTLERMDALADRDLLPSGSREEIAAAFDLLMGLRLGAQLAALRAGRPASSSLEVGRLGHTQRELLRQAFAQIAALQRQVSHEFPEAG